MRKGILMTFPALGGVGKDKNKNFRLDGFNEVTGVRYQKHVSRIEDLCEGEKKVLLARYIEALERISIVSGLFSKISDPVDFKSCEDKLYMSGNG